MEDRYISWGDYENSPIYGILQEGEVATEEDTKAILDIENNFFVIDKKGGRIPVIEDEVLFVLAGYKQWDMYRQIVESKYGQ
jgi:hypothetical protein